MKSDIVTAGILLFKTTKVMLKSATTAEIGLYNFS